MEDVKEPTIPDRARFMQIYVSILVLMEDVKEQGVGFSNGGLC